MAWEPAGTRTAASDRTRHRPIAPKAGSMSDNHRPRSPRSLNCVEKFYQRLPLQAQSYPARRLLLPPRRRRGAPALTNTVLAPDRRYRYKSLFGNYGEIL